jgi:periplasmic protein CpxP/Spy
MVDSKNADGVRQQRQRGLKRVVLGVMVAIAATLGLSAWAQHGPGGHGGGMGAGMFGGSPEHIQHMLDDLNASDAQRAQIKQIVKAAATDMKAQREAGRALHEKAMQVFTAPAVDANAAEQLRQQMLVQHEQMSRRVLQAMLEASNVLTPEQRAKLGEQMKKRSDRMHERMQRGEAERPKS